MHTADKHKLVDQIHKARDILMDVCIALNAPTAVRKPKRTPTPPMPKQPQYKGDTGLVRKALWECGWFKLASSYVFHDGRKDGSRIKVWFADSLFEATQAEQRALEGALREAFGDRIIEMGFVPVGSHLRVDKSFCIWLRK